jgi:hypothetical protein
MIRRLAADLDDLREAVEMTGAALDRSQQLLRLEMVGARTGHEDAVALQELDRELVEPAIRASPLGMSFLRLMKAGGSITTTSKRRFSACSCSITSKASPRIVAGFRPFAAAAACKPSKADADESTQVTSGRTGSQRTESPRRRGS